MATRQMHRYSRSRRGVVVNLRAIGRRIRQIRGVRFTQVEFSRILGIGQTQLSRYELGQSAPTLRIILILRTFSGRSSDWILTGDE
jgi:transcriptional regulator with XRE-family HTH domain